MISIKTKIISGTIGILTILSIVLGANLIGQENVYVCGERQIAMVCDKLSKINAEGIQTRCYFNDTYKVCKEGWIKFEEPVNVGNFTDYLCSGEMIKECISQEGKLILRVKA